MNITENQIEETLVPSLEGAAMEGAELIDIPFESSPEVILEKITQFVADCHDSSDPDVDLWTDRALPIGCLWAVQMIRVFGWHWARVIQHDHDDLNVIGIFSPDRSLAIYPFHYVFGCLQNGVYPTIKLAFSMLTAGQIPTQPKDSYTNLMDGVQHIIPPR